VTEYWQVRGVLTLNRPGYGGRHTVVDDHLLAVIGATAWHGDALADVVIAAPASAMPPEDLLRRHPGCLVLVCGRERIFVRTRDTLTTVSGLGAHPRSGTASLLHTWVCAGIAPAELAAANVGSDRQPLRRLTGRRFPHPMSPEARASRPPAAPTAVYRWRVRRSSGGGPARDRPGSGRIALE
jgi:hypothetical protein